MENEEDKLYVIARADLAPGVLLAQACHAAIAYGFRHPEEAAAWFWDSSNLVILECPDEAGIRRLTELAKAASIPYVLFKEPDLDMAVTAAAFGGGIRKLVSSLPLALRKASASMPRIDAAPTSSSGSRAPRASPEAGA